MRIKVHWIIDGIADLEAETPEAAEAMVNERLTKLMSENPELVDLFGARALQGKAYLPGADEPEIGQSENAS